MDEPRILLVYETKEGQTAKVAGHLAATMEEAGAGVEVHLVEDAPGRFDGFDGVVLGDSIHMTHHSRKLVKYATTHAAVLRVMPSALFQVSLTSATHDEEHDTRAHGFVDELIETTGWEPDLVGLFAGRIAYTRYGFVKRHVLKSIAKKEGLSTDTHDDAEYTDWDEVEHFARDVATHVRGSVAAAAEG